MQDQSTPLSSITETIHKILKDFPNPKILSERTFKTELTLLQLTKRPITHTYLCDYNTSIQVQYKTEKSKPLEQYDLNPFNRVMTHHYLMNQDNGEKNFLTFNCSDQVLRETYPGFNQNENSLLQKSYSGMFPSQNKSTSSILQDLPQDYQPSPYEPLWYFPRNIFDYFLKMRESLTVTDPFEKIRIIQWKLKVVNISKSNWYAFVIEVFKFKFLNQKIEIGQIIRTKDSDYPSQTFQLRNISSIVYDRQLQTILQEMRLQDIKLMFDNEINNDDEEISMCYHIRATQTTHKLPKLSQFVTLDKQGQVLKFNSKLPVHFVPIGELEGVCSFPQPINLKKQQKTQQQRQISTFSMRGLFEILNKQVIESQRISKKKKQRRYQQMKRLNENSPFADNLNKLVSRRLQSSLNHNQYMIEEGQVSDDEDQQIESSDIWSESMPQNQKRGRKNQNDAAEYSEILHKHSQKGINEDSDDEEQEEQNEYFRRYREDFQKQFTQQKRMHNIGTVQKEKQAPEQNEVQGTISREIEVTEGNKQMVQEQGQLIL